MTMINEFIFSQFLLTFMYLFLSQMMAFLRFWQLACICIVLLLGQFVMTSSGSEESVIRDTAVGKIEGTRKTVLDRKVDIFLGVPFAKPPVKELRFQPPQPIGKSDSIIKATKLPHSCWQEKITAFHTFPGVDMWNTKTELSEDCLYLNIWQPEGGSEKKAVMVWIHGGGFVWGTSSSAQYDGEVLASVGDVIVVSLQYRLGALGFMRLSGTKIAGNAGLMDQNLAIKWVHDNIQSFGGDKDRITLFGESTGAASVSYHLISPMSRDLFKYGILMSGSVPAEWSFVSPSEATWFGYALAKLCGCSTSTPEGAVDCLMKADPKEIVKQQNSFFSMNPLLPYFLVPTIDGKFLANHPLYDLENGDFKQTCILTGATSNEGTLALAFYLLSEKRMQNGTEIPMSSAGQFADDVKVALNSSIDSVVNHLVKVYGSPNSSAAYTSTLEQMIGDRAVKCPVERLAKEFYHRNLPVYYYEYGHRTSVNPWADWMGVMHGYEIDHVFGLPLAQSSIYTEQEKKFSREVIKYWTNFAKYG